MACSREASHSRGRPGPRPLGTAGGTSSGWDELQGPLFARDDDRVVLVLLVDRAGRGARRCADRASDDCADGAADDSTDYRARDAAGDRAPGLLVTVRGARHVVLPERFAMLGAVLDDALWLDDSVLCHGWISCRGLAPISAAREHECPAAAPPRHDGRSSPRGDAAGSHALARIHRPSSSDGLMTAAGRGSTPIQGHD